MNRLCLATTFVLAAICYARDADAVTLDTLLRKAVEENPAIQKAKCDLEGASGRRLIFRAVALPDALVGVAAGDQGGHRASEKPNQPFGFAYGGFIQPLFNMNVPPSLRRGDVEVLIAQQQLNVAVVEQLHAARVAFYTALYNRSLKGLREEQRQRLEENVGSQKARYESGLTDRSALVGAEAQTRELDPRIETAQRAYGGAVLKLAEAMGGDLDSSAKLPEPEGALNYKPGDVDLDEETGAALQRRPDLKLARLLVRAANEDQRMIEAALYPAINATVAGDYIPVSGVRRQSQGSGRRSDDIISSEVRAGAAYTWRVVDNGKIGGVVLKQRSAREINELLLHKLEVNLPRELSRIRNDLQAIAIKHRSLAEGVLAAEQNESTMKENLAGGVVSQLEFRLAENAFLEIKSGLLTLAYQQNLALAEWDRATGRYFQFSDETAQNVP